jgi:23S rRNA pseudouridine1911/1915/1917 synthase
MKHTLDILFQNDTILAVNKPTGLLSVPDRYNEEKEALATLVLAGFPTARPLHRLDFETSGIVLFCLQPDAFGWYSDQFEQRTITKQYLALTEGRSPAQGGTIDTPLYTQSTGRVIISKKGKTSQTRWQLLEGFQHHSFIEANPLTGRTHQIRVHLASIGLPVIADKFYGSGLPLFLSSLKGKNKYRLGKDEEQEKPLISRVALHASSLTFRDYTTSEWIGITCSLPKDLHVGLAKLRQYSSLSK